MSTNYSVFRPFGVTVKWTDSLTLLQRPLQKENHHRNRRSPQYANQNAVVYDRIRLLYPRAREPSAVFPILFTSPLFQQQMDVRTAPQGPRGCHASCLFPVLTLSPADIGPPARGGNYRDAGALALTMQEILIIAVQGAGRQGLSPGQMAGLACGRRREEGGEGGSSGGDEQRGRRRKVLGLAVGGSLWTERSCKQLLKSLEVQITTST